MFRSISCFLIAASLLVAASVSAQALLQADRKSLPEVSVRAADGTVDVKAVETLLDAQLGHDPRFVEAAQLFEKQPGRSRSAHDYWVMARAYMHVDPTTGAALLERAIGEHPKDVYLQALRVSYAVQLRCDRCFDAPFTTLREIAPEHPITYRTIGYYHQYKGWNLDAIRYLEASIPGQPASNLSWTYVLLGISNAKIGRFDASIAAWAKAAELSPYSPTIAAEHASALTNWGNDPEAAIREAQRAIGLPNSYLSLARRALAFATYARWAKLHESGADAAKVAAAFDAAYALEPRLDHVFRSACGFVSTKRVSVALLQSKKVPVSVIDTPDDKGKTCLWKLAAMRERDLVRMMIGLGADIDAQDANGLTPLMRAVAARDVETADLLLELGAEVNAMSVNGGNVLTLIAQDSARTLALAKRLLASGADPNAKTSLEGAPLHYAAMWLDVELAQLLLDHGAEVDAAMRDGTRALGIAVTSMGPGLTDAKRVAMIELLLSRGADAKRRQDGQESPLELARRHQPQVVKLLER